MKVGLLWHDSDPGHDLAEKVRQAAQKYRQKFGAPADVCFVHPSALSSDGPEKVGGVRVAPKPSVLRHHFWIGQEKPARTRGETERWP